ncbi:hypothetical protein [Cobetia sp. QF-1]|uniref:hypothetical protein n=1 Tax=Cobetia sp. QF-1 TaxID=1969833 RepID=UPI00159549E0|nr:hypothetical protein [Cobetia sp. QF-1]
MASLDGVARLLFEVVLTLEVFTLKDFALKVFVLKVFDSRELRFSALLSVKE